MSIDDLIQLAIADANDPQNPNPQRGFSSTRNGYGYWTDCKIHRDENGKVTKTLFRVNGKAASRVRAEASLKEPWE